MSAARWSERAWVAVQFALGEIRHTREPGSPRSQRERDLWDLEDWLEWRIERQALSAGRSVMEVLDHLRATEIGW